MSANPAETARCVDCYTVSFTDEMTQCSAGHWVCSGCLCDCSAHENAPALLPSWLQYGNIIPVEVP